MFLFEKLLCSPEKSRHNCNLESCAIFESRKTYLPSPSVVPTLVNLGSVFKCRLLSYIIIRIILIDLNKKAIRVHVDVLDTSINMVALQCIIQIPGSQIISNIGI